MGDQLVSSQGVMVPIESISNLSEITTVYNLRVADHHTYFVGGALWGWDVWVHNASYSIVVDPNTKQKTIVIFDKFEEASVESNQLRKFASKWNKKIAENGGAMKRRQPTPDEIRESNAWKAKMRKDQPSRFTDGKAVGHVPDAAAGGKAVPDNDEAMAFLHPVNQYIGGIVSRLPSNLKYHRVSITSKPQ